MIEEIILELQCYIVAFNKGCEISELTIEDIIEFFRIKELVDKFENKYLC